MRYIVETRNGNPAILELQENGSYKGIAFGMGEDSFPNLMALITLANMKEKN